jgi:hypothetical protein
MRAFKDANEAMQIIGRFLLQLSVRRDGATQTEWPG